MSIKRFLGNLRRALLGMISNIAEKSPALFDGDVVGCTILGEEIRCVRIGSGTKKILFVSGIHGNEVGTIKLSNHLIEWLKTERVSSKNLSFIIIPCLNLDGYAEARKHPDYFHGGAVGRFNANQVDLNRNFDTPSFQSNAYWTKGKNYQEKVPVFSGEKANSEPETRVLTELIEKEKPELVVAFHNAGRDVVGNTIKPSSEIVRIYSDETDYQIETNENWLKAKRTGTLKEWSEINKIPFLEVEGSSRWGSDWERQKGAIKKVIEFLDCSRSE